jgi:hypothetical protein
MQIFMMVFSLNTFPGATLSQKMEGCADCLSRGRGTVQDVPERSGPKGWRGVLEERPPPKKSGGRGGLLIHQELRFLVVLVRAPGALTIPKNTAKERSTLSIVASSNVPMCTPVWSRGTVAILSIMIWLVISRPLSGAGSTVSRSNGVSKISEEKRQTVTLGISANRSDWIMSAGRGLPE